MFAQLRDVKTTQDDMKKQLQRDNDKLTQQLELVTWQWALVNEKLDKQILYTHLWFTLLVGINLGVYICMLLMVRDGRYSACYVPKQNVTDNVKTDDIRVFNPTVEDLKGLLDLLGITSSRK